MTFIFTYLLFFYYLFCNTRHNGISLNIHNIWRWYKISVQNTVNRIFYEGFCVRVMDLNLQINTRKSKVIT